MTHPTIHNATLSPAILAQCREKALKLLQRQRTMVLATAMDQNPWAAPVYFVYRSPGVYFFSSPRSQHIQQAMASPVSAAAIYADGDRIDMIEGIQMTGQVSLVASITQRVSITARYLTKFPLAKPLLEGGKKAAKNIKQKVKLYCFTPDIIYYLDNNLDFGTRQQITL